MYGVITSVCVYSGAWKCHSLPALTPWIHSGSSQLPGRSSHQLICCSQCRQACRYRSLLLLHDLQHLHCLCVWLAAVHQKGGWDCGCVACEWAHVAAVVCCHSVPDRASCGYFLGLADQWRDLYSVQDWPCSTAGVFRSHGGVCLPGGIGLGCRVVDK